MNVLILAAGYGTRLAAIAKDTPKPLLEVNGKPLIDYAVEKVKSLPDLSCIAVVTNNKFYGRFVQWAQAHAPLPIKVINDGTNTPEERLGSVGDINYVWQKEPQPENWLVVGGDNLFDQPLDPFLIYARQKSPAVTIGLYDIGDIASATKFGVSAVDAQGKVVSFQEKPSAPKSSLITMCLYYFPRQTLAYMQEYLKGSNSLDAAGNYIQWLVEKKNVYGFNFKGKWYDIGSIESLNDAQGHFK